MHRTLRRPGFSVIELLVFIAALIVLISIAAPRLVRSLQHERQVATIDLVEPVPPSVEPGSVQQLVVRLTDQRGQPASGRRLEHALEGAGDSIAGSRITADTAGLARVTWHIGVQPGERTLRLIVPDSDIERTITTRVEGPMASPPVAAPSSAPAPQAEQPGDTEAADQP